MVCPAARLEIPNKLSARAPNIYLFVQHFLPVDLYSAATIAGVLSRRRGQRRGAADPFPLAPAVACGMDRRSAHLMAVARAVGLPKIHERYFFGADVFALLFAVLVPRAWWVAVLFPGRLDLRLSVLSPAIEYDLGVDFPSGGVSNT